MERERNQEVDLNVNYVTNSLHTLLRIRNHWKISIEPFMVYTSMTTLLTHTVAHSTKSSFRPKTNNQPLKKFLSLAERKT
jgi:hypothetical protein